MSGKPAARLGDIGSKHGKCSPTPIISGSGNVTINGKPAARASDALAIHCKHGRVIAAGSSGVTINGLAAARVGDAISCGGKVAKGSGNVLIGDKGSLLGAKKLNMPKIEFPSQTGSGGQYNTPKSTPSVLSPGEKVTIGETESETEVEQPPELKPATIRLAINPSNNMFGNDKFILSSTDGSISITKTVADDLIPGDDFLDLQFPNLDTSKNYKLEQVDGSSGETYTYFKSFSYGSIGIQSPAPSNEDDESEKN